MRFRLLIFESEKNKIFKSKIFFSQFMLTRPCIREWPGAVISPASIDKWQPNTKTKERKHPSEKHYWNDHHTHFLSPSLDPRCRQPRHRPWGLAGPPSPRRGGDGARQWDARSPGTWWLPAGSWRSWSPDVTRRCLCSAASPMPWPMTWGLVLLPITLGVTSRWSLATLMPFQLGNSCS